MYAARWFSKDEPSRYEILGYCFMSFTQVVLFLAHLSLPEQKFCFQCLSEAAEFLLLFLFCFV